jgi:hypothetical protein
VLVCSAAVSSDDTREINSISSVTVCAEWINQDTIAVSLSDIEHFGVAFCDLTLCYEPTVMQPAGWCIYGDSFGYWRETPWQSAVPGEITLAFGIDRDTQKLVEGEATCILIHFGRTGNPGWDEVWFGESAVYDWYAHEPQRFFCIGSAPQ